MNHRMFPRTHLIMFFGMAIISFFIMPFVMINSPADWRPSLNQAYAAIFMGASMVVLEGYMHPMPTIGWIITIALLVISVYAIRTQWGVTSREYLHDMIPHHSMAVLTSKAQIQNRDNMQIANLAEKIYATQVEEIEYMKKILGSWA